MFELITNAALFKAAHPTDLAVGMQTFLDDVQSMASHFTTFLEGLTLVLLRKTLGEDFANQGTAEEVIVNQSFSQVRIPYFCAPDEKTSA